MCLPDSLCGAPFFVKLLPAACVEYCHFYSTMSPMNFLSVDFIRHFSLNQTQQTWKSASYVYSFDGISFNFLIIRCLIFCSINNWKLYTWIHVCLCICDAFVLITFSVFCNKFGFDSIFSSSKQTDDCQWNEKKPK